MLVYGIGAAQIADKTGETINIQGIDTNDLRYVNDEHGERMADMLGGIKSYKKIFSEKDCEGAWQQKCWKVAKVPFLYFEGEINEDPEHEDAKAAKSLLRFVNAHPELPLRVGASIEGAIVERGATEKGQVGYGDLKHTLAKGISLTIKPCNPACQVFIAQDLQKSEPPSFIPEKYRKALLDTTLTPSFRETKLNALRTQVDALHKSMTNLLGQFTDIQCKSCGHSDRFFKSSSTWPNHCVACSSRFTMKELFKAVSK
jgi:ribosomal protein S27E